jgi:DNA polymerase III subunit delta
VTSRHAVARLHSAIVADLKSAYLVQGDDDVLIESWRARLRSRAEEEGPSASLEVLRGDRLSGTAVAEALGALTLAVGSRYVLADGVQGWKEKDIAPVAAALAAADPDTMVVFIASGKVKREKGPAPAALAKAVTACGGEVRTYEAPPVRALPKWVAEQGEKLGLNVTQDGAEALVELVGVDENRNPRQRRLLRELEKIACLAPDDGRVDRDVVESLTVSDIEVKVFELADALIEGERERTLSLAEDLGVQGEDTMHVLFGVLRKLRDARRAWAMLEAGRPERDISAALGVPPWIGKRIVEQARRADGERLEVALGELAELDYAVRGGGNLDSGTALTLALRRAAA